MTTKTPKRAGPRKRTKKLADLDKEIAAIQSGDQLRKLATERRSLDRDQALKEAKLGRDARRLIVAELEGGDLDAVRAQLRVLRVKPSLIERIAVDPETEAEAVPPAETNWGPDLIAILMAQPGADRLAGKLRGYLAEVGLGGEEIDTLVPAETCSAEQTEADL